MRASQYLLATLKETPTDAETISHQLMLRAGLIRKVASGLYTWLPSGLRVLQKVEAIVRDEMNRTGAQELLMPVVQPAELWQESGRWEEYGKELLRINDRHDRAFCLGPTHEEVITDLIRNEIQSYKHLPANFYQIQTKFRDEIRPRFGVMRSREFIMKDAYSFHLTQESLQQTYDAMYQAYNNIFTRLGLNFRPVLADTGSIGGSASHEFHVLAESGEDAIAFSTESDFAANIEKAEAIAPQGERPEPSQPLKKVSTPNQKTIKEICQFLSIKPEQSVKTLIVKGETIDGKSSLVALIIRGDHELNTIKAEKLPQVSAPLALAEEADIKSIIGCDAGFIGPVGLTIPIIVDASAAHLSDFTCGANENDVHLTGVNWQRDVDCAQIEDIRNVIEGDPSPDGKGTLQIKRGIEVGHIFQLGDKYSSALSANVQDENGKNTTLTMGCYGIGVTRVVAAAIEQNNDENGIIWPESIAPFLVAIVPINMHKSDNVSHKVLELYQRLTNQGIDVLLMDEHKARLGGMLADVELMGIPHTIIVGDKGLEKGLLEYKHRRTNEKQELTEDDVIQHITQKNT